MLLPEGYRGCKKCGKLKPLNEMVKSKKCKWGRLPRCNECQAEYKRSREWKESYLKRKYNLSIAEYESMIEEQNNSCLICSEEFIKTPHVDHCHETGDVRGLLCHHCNTGIGLFRDDPELLEKAIAYLENSRAVS